MRLSRFFVEPACVDRKAGTIAIKNSQQIRQITQVLRLRSGDRIDILDGTGFIYNCRLNSFTTSKSRHPAELICSIDAQSPASGESAFQLVVALPVLRANRFEWAIEKLTELGATWIVPLQVERSVVVYDSAKEAFSPAKLERWQAIAREAAEQCERALIPNVVKPEDFDRFVKRSELIDAAKFIGAERADATALIDAIDSAGGAKTICIAVGAEGGFTEAEIGLSFTHGFRPVSLGQRILRAETAAVYAASVVVSRLDK